MIDIQEDVEDIWSEETMLDVVRYHVILTALGMSEDAAAEFLHNVANTFIKEFSNDQSS